MGDKTVVERQILFSGAMVRAILDGRKTQTRRVVKPQPYQNGRPEHWSISELQQFCPYGQPGDRLWVRETWQHSNFPLGPYDESCQVFYRADYLDDPHGPDGELSPEGKYVTWRPSIHMPRAACRIVLEITGVRVERLQDISEADALAEGIESLTGDKTIYHWDFPKPRPPYAVSGYKSARDAYKELWVEINGRESLDANPWVWVIEFKRVEASS